MSSGDHAHGGGSLLYFDHAATAPRRREVTEAMAPYTSGVVGNPSGSHRAARAARRALDDAREEVAELTGSLPGGVVFTSGGTESCTMAIFGVAAHRARRGRPTRLAVSSIEHHAVLDTARRLTGGVLSAPVEVATLPVDRRAVLDLDAVAPLVSGASLVSVMVANNEVGTVQPVAALATIVREVAPDAVVHADAVAAAPWLDLGLAAQGVDLVSICAHKLGGPVGIGALCIRREVPLEPLLVGGGQERGRRAGTPDVASAVGLATALRLAADEWSSTAALVAARRDLLQKLLTSAIDGVTPTIEGADVLPGTCHVLVDGVASEELVYLCDDAGLCVSAASSCSSGAATMSHVLAAMGTDLGASRAALRLTLGVTTSDDEVERAAAIVVDAIRRLRSATR